MNATRKAIAMLMNGGILWCTRTADYEEFNLHPSEIKGKVFAYTNRENFEANRELWSDDNSESVRVFDAMLGMGILKLVDIEQVENGEELTINSTAIWSNGSINGTIEIAVPLWYCQQMAGADDKDVFVL